MSKIPFKDKVIAKVAEEHPIPQLKITTNLFIDLVENIVCQQLSGRVAEVIFKRFCALFPNNIPTPKLLLRISIEQLRNVGLSNSKANYVHNIAHYALLSNLSVDYFDKLSDEQIVAELTRIKGVGVWTAQMVLIFSLNRPDVFPVGDLAIQQGMKKMYNLTEEGKDLLKKITSISDSWKPNRTIGTRYVWKYVNIQKTLNTRA